MTLKLGLLAAALASGAALGQQPGPTPQAVAVPADTVAVAPTPAPTLVENLIKLWKANLSEDFLRKYIDSADIRRDLTAEDIIQLRNAGIPESLITVATEHKAPGGAVPAGGSPRPSPSPLAPPLSVARWEGLARYNGGIVILKNRWDPGVLEFKDESLRWTDSHDAAKNVLLTAKQVTEQQLTCLKKPGGNECFEWVVKAKGQQYRFRDIAWEQGEDAKVEEVFKFMKTLYPGLVSSQVPVDSK